ncbi:flagellar biosynthetic protein FliR [Vitreimonas flagellata]|uniref:flagellar biosynthetic protein FliR n=1 Tax=Vitreimonas flagellata TaxID=2560861 RepID=UPI001074FDD1|nr:flagellar biosynthetic protein FliR [Vitreimonas flagellata]
MELSLYGVDVWSAALLFARIAGVIMLLPGFSEPAIPARVRLGFALVLAICLAPTLADRVPDAATSAWGMAFQVSSEALIGILIGGAARFLMTALATAGQIVGLEIGLAFAQTADPTMTQSGQLTSVFLSMLGLALMFATGLHHMFLQGVVGSYDLISLGAPPPVGDAADLALTTAATSFRVGFQIAMPVVAAGLIFRVGLGVLSRLIPQIQVFFIIMPLQILGGLVVFALGLSTGMLIWLDSMQSYALWVR